MLTLEEFRNKRVCILGFETEGMASFAYLKKHGVDAAICDALPRADFLSKHPEVADEELYLGDEYLIHAVNFDVIVKTPGISPLRPELVEAVKQGVILTSQLEIFMDECPCKVVGVTGTKGKGTTSTLITTILRAAGRDVFLGGNIGTPALTFIDQLSNKSIVVLELSSFQLQTLKVSPHIAVLLNTTSEHLDYHKDTEEYRDAKANILRYQREDDFAIVSGDYDVPQAMSTISKARKLLFSRYCEVEGCYVDNDDRIVLKYDDQRYVLGVADEMQLRGRHNLENITAASLAASVCGVSSEVIAKTIKEFVGLEHRLELVADISGVKYYDDSFSTVPETAIAALDSFTEPIVLIAGGSSKKSDYSSFGKKLTEVNLRGLVIVGDTAEEIISAIPEEVHFPIIKNISTMKEMVSAARSLAQPGDVVLLSPACASKGLFKNYKDRGDQFKNAVLDLNI